MRLNSYCIRCLLDRQQERIKNFEDEEKKTAYMKEIAKAIGESGKEDSAPYMVWVFKQIYRRYFGDTKDYKAIKKDYNEYVLKLEDALYEEILKAPEPLEKAIIYARIGNYIDFGAMQHVDKEQFLALFREEEKNALDEAVYQAFLSDCERGKNFLLIADNCGEIVLDKLFLRELKKRFPHLKNTVMVRGEEVLNDVTAEDAEAVGLLEEAKIVSNGNGVAGTVEKLLGAEGMEALSRADIILAKGQANFDTMNGCGRNIYYSFLCKCDWFSGRFQVPMYTGMFVRERGRSDN